MQRVVQMSLDRVGLAFRLLSNTMRFISTGFTGFDSRLEVFLTARRLSTSAAPAGKCER
jgi:hypothetical protein